MLMAMELNIGKINSELERLGWTQAKLAAEIGVTRQYINQVLAGEIGKTFVVVDKIAKALGIEPKDLVIN